MHIAKQLDYWEEAYRRSSGALYPSQFATFVVGQSTGIDTIIDIGCGNGRDSSFFSRSGFTVVGVDGSLEAIAQCKKNHSGQNLSNTHFLRHEISDADMLDSVRNCLAEKASHPKIVYSRFFVHAITEEDQSALLQRSRALLADGGFLALEFRTSKDASLPKKSDPHFRRYISSHEIISSLRDHALSVSYFVEGFGYANYMEEDPHIARLIARFSQ